MLSDFRTACRSLARARAFTLIAVGTLALGLGANTAIFSAVYSLLLHPLPFAGADRLVSLRTMVLRDQWERRSFSHPDFLDYRAQAGASFEAFVAFADSIDYNLAGEPEAARVRASLVSHDYFSVLGVAPALGRTFTAEEDSVPDKFPVVILGDELWRTRFGADPAIIGRTIRLSEKSYTVVGVMPPGFINLYADTQLWLPMSQGGASSLTSRSARWHGAFARLKPGVTLEQARAELATVGRQLAAAHPASNTNYRADLVPLREEFFGELRRPLLVLLGAVGLVLLITCANVANLLLVRLSARRSEIAIRASLGAGRAALARLFLAESAVLAFLGGAFGLLLAVWLVDLLAPLNPVDLPAYARPALHWPVFAFALGATLACALGVGLLPAIFAARADLGGSLKDTARGSTAGAGTRVRAGLVVAEIALSLALLAGSVLLVRSFFNLVNQAPGYRTTQLLSLRVTLPAQSYPADTVRQFARLLLERASALPGARTAALASDLPLDDDYSATFITIEGGSAVPAENEARAFTHIVSPDFFAATGIRLLEGATFAAAYPADSEPVVIISENFARRFWPDGSAIGRRFKRGRTDVPSPWMRIVGIVAETKFRSLVANPTRDPDFYAPHDQRPTRSFALLVHTAGPSAALGGDLRALVTAIDPNVPAFDVRTIEQRIDRASAGARFSAQLMAAFALAALLLAALGLYGVVSFMVGLRVREIGVRMALGAQPADILRLVLGGTGRLVLLGLILGVALALGLSRFIASLLFNVPAHDPATYAVVSIVLGLVAFLAAWLPARRAARVDPTVALRAE